MLRIILPFLLMVGSASPVLCDDAGQAAPPDKAADMQSMKDFL